MPRDRSFSEDLLDYIQDRETDYESDLTATDREEHQKLEKLVKVIVTYVLESRQNIIKNPFKQFETVLSSAPEFVSELLDERYTRQALTEIPSYVRRTLDLSHMQAERLPSKVTNVYLQEATRTYILGLAQACVALSRAALEQGLKEVLGHQLTASYLTFRGLVDDAVKYHVLDKQTARIARSLAKQGDEVLHEIPVELTNARDVLIGVRGLLQGIYSSKGGY